jgi:hypothetical protein
MHSPIQTPSILTYSDNTLEMHSRFRLDNLKGRYISKCYCYPLNNIGIIIYGRKATNLIILIQFMDLKQRTLKKQEQNVRNQTFVQLLEQTGKRRVRSSDLLCLTSCSSESSQLFCLVSCLAYSSALKMEAIHFSETSGSLRPTQSPQREPQI